jgi:hypothetical protein
MKGVVFTEFLDMVEAKFSPEMVDDIVDAASLPHGGAYTAVGTYPYTEMASLVVELSKRSGIPVPNLLKDYGKHLFGRFHQGYGQFFNGIDDCFSFLETINEVVHIEVRKLYPGAELPEFSTERPAHDHLRMVYRSPRCLGDLAEGLLIGCVSHFGGGVKVSRKDSQAGQEVSFDLVKTT